MKDGRVVAFASTIRRGKTHLLSMFWALPTLQSKGIGRRLLTRAFERSRPPASAVRCVFASLDTRAQTLYLEFGMRPRGVFYLLKGTPRRSLRPRRTVDLVQSSSMVSVIERTPSVFVNMDEEGIRVHFLVQLNGQYEGQATGETFNGAGKTDILVRVGDRNIFIAECKSWDGPKSLRDAIDQFLGYATWRDSKMAIFLFNRTRQLSMVLARVPEVVGDHPAFVRRENYAAQTGFRFVLKRLDDPARELLLSVLVFEVPADA